MPQEKPDTLFGLHIDEGSLLSGIGCGIIPAGPPLQHFGCELDLCQKSRSPPVDPSFMQFVGAAFAGATQAMFSHGRARHRGHTEKSCDEWEWGPGPLHVVA